MMLLFFISAQYVGNMIRKQYDRPHIVYSILAGIFLVLQVVIILGVKFALAAVGDIMVIFNVNLYFFYVYAFFKVLFTTFSFNYIFMLLIIVVGVYVGIAKTYQ